MNETVYITGHKNPDTDSICSSIAYAELKKKFGVNAVPVRIGTINRETKFVLDYFGVEEPAYLNTVKTQVADLNMDIINPVSKDISIKTAWHIMQSNNQRILPVADENEKLLGVITLSDITKNYMDTFESNILSTSDTPLRNIMETLKATLAVGEEKGFHLTGKVVVAAMMPDRVGQFLEKGDMVLLGDRKESQIYVIKAGASCLILTCGSKADQDVIQLAKQYNCIILETKYDTFSAARLIDQSIPVRYVMTQKNLNCFHVKDYVDSIRDRMIQTRFRSYPVVDEKGCIKGFISRYHLINARKKKVILVDHNEKSQTVDGIDEAEILEIVDHHRIGDIQTSGPIFFKNDTVGSTATLISSMYFENGIIPSKKIAGLLYAAIISDTLNLKSPTSTYLDSKMASHLAEIAEVDREHFAEKMFQAGSVLNEMSPEQILHYDFKEYQFNKYKIGVGQVNSSNSADVQHAQEKLLDYLKDARKENNYDLLMLMITDIVRNGSLILFVSEKAGLPKGIFGKPDTTEGAIFADDVVSRKKQVVPLISDAVRGLSAS
ncbi:MAG: putative manganese-dependent inorganic diphosphatase [Oscillospiraceae bacterium]|nr:putative manganese-dependent inorganic diphosphatase [Oscillospiraceae bacterium]